MANTLARTLTVHMFKTLQAAVKMVRKRHFTEKPFSNAYEFL